MYLTHTVLVTIIHALRGDGEVGSARYEPALLPPCPSIRVLSYSNSRDPLTPADGPGTLSVKDLVFGTSTIWIVFYSIERH